MSGNSIANIASISSLSALEILLLDNNSIVDLPSFASLTSLVDLSLAGNSIVDVAPLAALTGFTGDLDLSDNAIIAGVDLLGQLSSAAVINLSGDGNAEIHSKT